MLAFVSMGIFANASNRKPKLIKFPVQKENGSDKKPLNVQWQSSFSCNGITYTVCCFDTQALSHAAALATADRVCY